MMVLATEACLLAKSNNSSSTDDSSLGNNWYISGDVVVDGKRSVGSLMLSNTLKFSNG